MAQNNKGDSLTVVGIGASAGGLEPIQELLSSLPKEIPSTAIVIVQHLSPDYKSMLVDLLARKTTIPVKRVENDMLIEENTIYIAPATSDAEIVDGYFALRKPIDSGAHPNINILFSSIASVYGTSGVGIILSGTGKDGSRGIVQIKNAGGIVMSQDPENARYDGMPQSALDTDVVDHVLSPDEIGKNFLDLIKNSVSNKVKKDEDHPDSVQSSTAIQIILELLEKRIGIDFSDYKLSTIKRRIQKRIQDKKFKSDKEYLSYVRHTPEELDKLFESILIGVTAFFRDEKSFKKLEEIYKEILSNKKDSDTMRIWIPGCATGEEAYTHGIIVSEVLHSINKRLPVQIFATDIDLHALQKARKAKYTEHEIAGVSKKLRDKYFIKTSDDLYLVRKDIIKMVLFSKHDVISNPPFLRLDLISCRNLLIYFNITLQKKVLPLFCYALNKKGYMMLGKSEDIGKFKNLFSTVDAHHKIFQKKVSDGAIRLPNMWVNKPKHVGEEASAKKREDLSMTEMVKETLYNTFDHPYVVIDSSMEITEISGEMAPYLKFKSGGASLNITKLIHPDLQIELRAMISKLTTTKQIIRGNIRKFGAKNESRYIRISIKPVSYTKKNNPYYVVVFEELTLDEKFFVPTDTKHDKKANARIMELEQDLEATKDYTNSLLQELETSNEELQAMNEELQSSNEELQASNEELESSNEELQATNEELENAYSQIRESNTQIEKQKSKLQHSEQNLNTLLNNTQVAFILVDKDYKVLSFNKIASSEYNTFFGSKLEKGASFVKMLNEENFPMFIKHFRRSLDGEQVITQERVLSKERNIHYLHLNYTPVQRQSEDDEVTYVSISLLDVTQQVLTKDELNYQKSILEAQQEVSPQGVLIVSPEGKMIYYNQRFLDMWKFPKHVSEINIDKVALKAAQEQLVDPDGFIKKVQHLYKTQESSNDELHFKDGRIFDRYGSAVIGQNKTHYGYVWFFLDITEKKRIERQRDEFVAIATHELKTPVTSIKSYAQVLQKQFEKTGDELSEKAMVKIDTQLNKLISLIGDLLDITKIDNDKLDFNEEFFNITDVVKETVEDLQRTTDKHTLIEKINGSYTVYGDKNRIGQVLINLISNAIKYSPNNDKIIIEAKKQKATISISITDYGIGLTKEDQERIFKRFYRADDNIRKTISGFGLGLYIANEIVKHHGGVLKAESNGKNKGTTFVLTLPINEPKK